MRRLAALLATVAISTAPVAAADPTTEPVVPPSPDTTSAPSDSVSAAVPSDTSDTTGEPQSPPSGGGTSEPSGSDGSPPVVQPPDTPPAEENPPTEPPHDNIPKATPPHQRNWLETILLKPHFTPPVQSAATGQNIPIAQCHRVRGGNKSTPNGGSPSRARSHVSC